VHGGEVCLSPRRAAVVALATLIAGCGLQEHPRGRREPAPAPLPALTGVVIDGRFVPRDRAVVFIHFGHSNMAGLAQTPQALQPMFFEPQAQLWSYQGGGRFIPAVEPTAAEPAFAPSAGPGLAWLKTVAAAADPSYHFISLAWARSGAESKDYVKGGLYYSQLMDRALELKGQVTFAAIFIMLGITELPVPVPEEVRPRFAQTMARVIADMRQDLGEPALPVLHTDYEVEAGDRWAITHPIGQSLRAQFVWLPRQIDQLALIPADGTPMIDNHHFDLVGHKLWVERGVQLMKDRGWFLWGK
jgi:hypothetical protein